jgi:hypothetical protein
MKMAYKNGYVRFTDCSESNISSYLVLENIKYPISIGKEIKLARKMYVVMCMGNMESNVLNKGGSNNMNGINNRNSLQNNFDSRIR